MRAKIILPDGQLLRGTLTLDKPAANLPTEPPAKVTQKVEISGTVKINYESPELAAFIEQSIEETRRH